MARSNSASQRERELARWRARQEAQEQARRRAARRQILIGVGVVAGVALAVVGVIRAASSESERKAASRTTTGPSTTAARPAADLPVVAPGEALEGVAPCPPTDGSARRVTRFAQPPPDCLSPGTDYRALIRTSEGVIDVEVNEESQPAANTFVFLSRYHYYDGLPVTAVLRGAYAEVGDPPQPDGSPGPGFRQPAPGNRQASVVGPLLLGLTPGAGTTGGGLTIGMPGNEFAKIPGDTAIVGVITDSRPDRGRGLDEQKSVQQLINDLASPSGAPTGVVTIDGIDIVEEPKV